MEDLEFGRRRLRVFVFGIALICIAIAGVNWYLTRDNPRVGSVTVGAGGSWRMSPVASYLAVVREDTRGGPTKVLTTEREWFHRPFEGRIESWTGPPPGTRRLSVRLSAFGTLVNENPNSEPLNIAITPSVASGDLRLDASISFAVAHHIVVRRERRKVYGRECQVYRAGGPVFAGDLTTYVPGHGDYADVCLDRHGIVLEEVWVSHGKLLRRTAVTELQIDPPLDGSLFAVDVPRSSQTFPGSIDRIDPSDPNLAHLWGPSTPRGFVDIGAYAVVLPSGATMQQSQVPQPGPASTARVFVRGPDVIVVDQGADLAAAAGAENRPSIDANVNGMTNSKLLVDGRMSEVRGTTSDGMFVRVFGTLAPDELLKLAGELRQGAS